MSKVKETSTNALNKKALFEECSEMLALYLIGGQWKLVICYTLLLGEKMRFADLKREIPLITDRMLSLELRNLEENKIIKRTVYPEVPPRVEYELTEIGTRLRPAIMALEQWGNEYKALFESEIKEEN